MKTTTFYILALTMLMASCGQEPTLQKYFVESSDDKGFMVLDIAPTIIQTDKIKLTEEEKVALNSLDKFNILAYTTDKNNPAKLKQEQEKVKQLLKGEEYEELMHIGSNEQGASIHTIGEGDAIEEFVIYAHNKETGLAVVRVMGEDMNPNNVMTLVGLLQKAPIDSTQLKPLRDIMAPQFK
jgi:hypothetical protein